jgi:beta-lactamase class C
MMLETPAPVQLQKSVNLTLTGYYRTPYFVQGLAWQEYSWPISINKLIASTSMKELDSKAEKLNPPYSANRNMLVIRTGLGKKASSIMGFLPKKHIGVVILINKQVSTEDRMSALYHIIYDLDNLPNKKFGLIERTRTRNDEKE